uniref:Uncharacterized protein n=2 Tax=Knipowitschia caucasica TaxID=637954 RepID=A0AAV2K5D3_KNICA
MTLHTHSRSPAQRLLLASSPSSSSSLPSPQSVYLSQSTSPSTHSRRDSSSLPPLILSVPALLPSSSSALLPGPSLLVTLSRAVLSSSPQLSYLPVTLSSTPYSLIPLSSPSIAYSQVSSSTRPLHLTSSHSSSSPTSTCLPRRHSLNNYRGNRALTSPHSFLSASPPAPAMTKPSIRLPSYSHPSPPSLSDTHLTSTSNLPSPLSTPLARLTPSSSLYLSLNLPPSLRPGPSFPRSFFSPPILPVAHSPRLSSSLPRLLRLSPRTFLPFAAHPFPLSFSSLTSFQPSFCSPLEFSHPHQTSRHVYSPSSRPQYLFCLLSYLPLSCPISPPLLRSPPHHYFSPFVSSLLSSGLPLIYFSNPRRHFLLSSSPPPLAANPSHLSRPSRSSPALPGSQYSLTPHILVQLSHLSPSHSCPPDRNSHLLSLLRSSPVSPSASLLLPFDSHPHPSRSLSLSPRRLPTPPLFSLDAPLLPSSGLPSLHPLSTPPQAVSPRLASSPSTLSHLLSPPLTLHHFSPRRPPLLTLLLRFSSSSSHYSLPSILPSLIHTLDLSSSSHPILLKPSSHFSSHHSSLSTVSAPLSVCHSHFVRSFSSPSGSVLVALSPLPSPSFSQPPPPLKLLHLLSPTSSRSSSLLPSPLRTSTSPSELTSPRILPLIPLTHHSRRRSPPPHRHPVYVPLSSLKSRRLVARLPPPIDALSLCYPLRHLFLHNPPPPPSLSPHPSNSHPLPVIPLYSQHSDTPQFSPKQLATLHSPSGSVYALSLPLNAFISSSPLPHSLLLPSCFAFLLSLPLPPSPGISRLLNSSPWHPPQHNIPLRLRRLHHPSSSTKVSFSSLTQPSSRPSIPLCNSPPLLPTLLIPSNPPDSSHLLICPSSISTQTRLSNSHVTWAHHPRRAQHILSRLPPSQSSCVLSFRPLPVFASLDPSARLIPLQSPLPSSHPPFLLLASESPQPFAPYICTISVSVLLPPSERTQDIRPSTVHFNESPAPSPRPLTLHPRVPSPHSLSPSSSRHAPSSLAARSPLLTLRTSTPNSSPRLSSSSHPASGDTSTRLTSPPIPPRLSLHRPCPPRSPPNKKPDWHCSPHPIASSSGLSRTRPPLLASSLIPRLILVSSVLSPSSATPRLSFMDVNPPSSSPNRRLSPPISCPFSPSPISRFQLLLVPPMSSPLIPDVHPIASSPPSLSAYAILPQPTDSSRTYIEPNSLDFTTSSPSTRSLGLPQSPLTIIVAPSSLRPPPRSVLLPPFATEPCSRSPSLASSLSLRPPHISINVHSPHKVFALNLFRLNSLTSHPGSLFSSTFTHSTTTYTNKSAPTVLNPSRNSIPSPLSVHPHVTLISSLVTLAQPHPNSRILLPHSPSIGLSPHFKSTITRQSSTSPRYRLLSRLLVAPSLLTLVLQPAPSHPIATRCRPHVSRPSTLAISTLHQLTPPLISLPLQSFLSSPPPTSLKIPPLSTIHTVLPSVLPIYLPLRTQHPSLPALPSRTHLFPLTHRCRTLPPILLILCVLSFSLPPALPFVSPSLEYRPTVHLPSPPHNTSTSGAHPAHPPSAVPSYFLSLSTRPSSRYHPFLSQSSAPQPPPLHLATGLIHPPSPHPPPTSVLLSQPLKIVSVRRSSNSLIPSPPPLPPPPIRQSSPGRLAWDRPPPVASHSFSDPTSSLLPSPRSCHPGIAQHSHHIAILNVARARSSPTQHPSPSHTSHLPILFSVSQHSSHNSLLRSVTYSSLPPCRPLPSNHRLRPSPTPLPPSPITLLLHDIQNLRLSYRPSLLPLLTPPLTVHRHLSIPSSTSLSTSDHSLKPNSTPLPPPSDQMLVRHQGSRELLDTPNSR